MKNDINILNERISLLKYQQAQQIILLKDQIDITLENLKPINLIKNTMQEVAASNEIKDNLMNNAIGLTTGYLSKKVLIGATHNPIKRIVGTLLQFAIANFVANHSETIKAVGTVLVRRLFFQKKNLQSD
ncbi:MAG: hypothetical protein V4683_18745 [Bacteroidota bacterium]